MYKLQWLKNIQYTLLANTSVQKLSTSVKLVTLYYCLTVYFLLSFMILIAVVSVPQSIQDPVLLWSVGVLLQEAQFCKTKTETTSRACEEDTTGVFMYRDALVSVSNYYVHWNPWPNSVVQYVCNEIRVLFRALPVFILPRLSTKINLHIFSTTTTRFWKWKFPQNDFVKARAFCQV